MLNISVDDFISLLTGTKLIVTEDNVGTPQCVDPIQAYARILGAPRFTGNAEDIINQAGDSFEQILNTPTNAPLKGDIVVFSSQYNGTVGHVVIASEDGQVMSFKGFSQNDPVGSDCEIKEYQYGPSEQAPYVLGWLHPKA